MYWLVNFSYLRNFGVHLTGRLVILVLSAQTPIFKHAVMFLELRRGPYAFSVFGNSCVRAAPLLLCEGASEKV